MFKGILRTGIVAIGGETTGVAIFSEGSKLELIIPLSMRPMLPQLNGKEVIVIGEKVIIRGVEIPFRQAIKVQKLGLLYR